MNINIDRVMAVTGLGKKRIFKILEIPRYIEKFLYEENIIDININYLPYVCTQKAETLYKITELAQETFESPTASQKWFNTTKIKGTSPNRLMQKSEKGLQIVYETLKKL